MIDPKDTPAHSRVLDAIARLEASRRRADNTVIGAPREKTTVTVELLQRLAGSKYASPVLQAFAVSVATGDSSWDRIEVDAQPLPPEVSDMRADPMVIWPRHWPLPSDDEPYRIPWQ